MLVFVSKTKTDRLENIEELPSKDFKVSLFDADNFVFEDRSGNRHAFGDFDCIIWRRIKEGCKIAESKGQECVISIVRYEEEKVKFSRVVDVKVA
jgi:hypothetical protein